MLEKLLQPTALLDYEDASIQSLIKDRTWGELNEKERIGEAYDFVRNEIKFGYNTKDSLPASHVLKDGYGQCNTKVIALMALLRALGIPCRFHGFTINKSLQRGIVPELVYPLAPDNIIHSWVEIWYRNQWVDLEGFILDEPVLESLQSQFPDKKSLCAYGAGTDSLQAPGVEWNGGSTYIQRTGINHDFGVFDSPDDFYSAHRQLTGLKGLLYRVFVRHWMNRRVEAIRGGNVPEIPTI